MNETGYYLLDHPNPNGPHFYTSRLDPLDVIVLHVTAGLEDLDGGIDISAEQTARYAATTDRKVSWHAGADSDSFLYLLPDEYTAWHCQGFNSESWGLEFSKATVDWSKMSSTWIQRTLENGALATHKVMKKNRVPKILRSKREIEQGARGFAYHSTLDPTRRKDPGANFPIAQFFGLLDDLDTQPTPTPPPTPQVQEDLMFIVTATTNTQYLITADGFKIPIASVPDATAFEAAGAVRITLTDKQINRHPTRSV